MPGKQWSGIKVDYELSTQFRRRVFGQRDGKASGKGKGKGKDGTEH